MLSIIQGKGFHMTFKNNVTVSVQFGYGNYCSNYNNYKDIAMKRCIEVDVQSPDTEIAIWADNGVWITSQFMEEVMGVSGDDVYGYCDIDIVFKALEWAKNYKENNYE